jgi:hypothetical protein
MAFAAFALWLLMAAIFFYVLNLVIRAAAREGVQQACGQTFCATCGRPDLADHRAAALLRRLLQRCGFGGAAVQAEA